MIGVFINKFQIWFRLKSRLDLTNHRPPYFKEGEVWWCHIGENIGIEMNGKSDIFTRPVIIFKKYDQYSFLAIPITTKRKIGSWYHSFYFKDREQTAILSQGKTMDYRRLKEKIGQLDKDTSCSINAGFINLHKK